MNKSEIVRLEIIEKRLKAYFEECGLNIFETDFEIVTADKMLEALARHLPTNFSHWSHGKDYEIEKARYDSTGYGIPYEVVWNFDRPIAYLVDTNPFALNALIVAHVFGHVDFHVSNLIMQHGRKMKDVIIEARSARKRFEEYRRLYGKEAVDMVIEAAMAFRYHQDPDMLAEEVSEEDLRETLLAREQQRLNELDNDLAMTMTEEGKVEIKKKIEESRALFSKYETQTPPEPEYDILKYLLEKSPKMSKPWVADIVSVIREQARAIAPNRRTKLTNEGWASYWHIRGLRQLVEEGLLSFAECEEAISFHAKVVPRSRAGFNVYAIGLAFWESIEDRWNKGKFGPEWDNCKDRYARANWDKKRGLGRQKMLELRQVLTDRTVIENYFTDDYIRDEELYIYKTQIVQDRDGKLYEDYVIAEDRPPVIREILRRSFSSSGIPNVAVINGNLSGTGQLVLQHYFSGFELNPEYENGSLEKLHALWGRPVHLYTHEIVSQDEKTGAFKLKTIKHHFDGKNHVIT